MPVDPKPYAVTGVLASPDVSSLQEIPALGVICTPPVAVLDLIDSLGTKGTGAAVMLTVGPAYQHLPDELALQQVMFDHT